MEWAQQALNLLELLPRGACVHLERAGQDPIRAEARDFPGEGRRYTVNGMWEWFVDIDMFERVGITAVTVLTDVSIPTGVTV